MSKAASTWAGAQVTGSVGAHAVLMTLAEYADARGCSFPSIAHLADRTEQSPATVRRKLTDLEARGLIERVKRLRDKRGQATNLFRLLMDFPVSARNSAPAAAGDLMAGMGPSEAAQ